MELKPTPPRDAKSRYLTRKEAHVSEKTLYNYNTALKRFLEYLATQNIEDMRNVDSDEIARFEAWRLDDVKPITARNDMRTIKNFIQFCESIQAVPVGLHELVQTTKVSDEDEICDDVLTRQEAKAILKRLSKYDYASLRHVIVLTLWKTGMRLGGLRALDVGDFDEGRPAIEIRHRAESGTPLKRKSKSERDVLITPEVAEVLADYISTQRPDVTDDHGRKPLIATDYGRASRTTITKHVYLSTSPCFHNGGKCPFDRDADTCEATQWGHASKCPGSVSPHALRRGYVTAARNAGQPKDVTGDRVNMSGKILDKHYDKGSYDEKAERRKDHLRDI
ncbi:tyrosine-type recombinase/integrase [Halorarum salinum]|uniref:Site-specific integrase n=1 Tax=Halorarum salinum TaxID=2743089 RepID=A0A7D5QE57_9EURY|nr:site-specific integrase [Halobaculum salinum]QLG60503.1 site-specific integrase [Halobaculum salinum]